MSSLDFVADTLATFCWTAVRDWMNARLAAISFWQTVTVSPSICTDVGSDPQKQGLITTWSPDRPRSAPPSAPLRRGPAGCRPGRPERHPGEGSPAVEVA